MKKKSILLLIPLLLIGCSSVNNSSITNGEYSSSESFGSSSVSEQSNNFASSESSQNNENEENDLELLSFYCDYEKEQESKVKEKVIKNKKTNVGKTNHTLHTIVKNSTRKSFIDMTLYIETLDTFVVCNEGNGEYVCSVTTKYDSDYGFWVSDISYDFVLQPIDGYKETIKIESINFLDFNSSSVQAKLPNEIDRELSLIYDFDKVEFMFALNDKFVNVDELGNYFITYKKEYLIEKIDIESLLSIDNLSEGGNSNDIDNYFDISITSNEKDVLEINNEALKNTKVITYFNTFINILKCGNFNITFKLKNKNKQWNFPIEIKSGLKEISAKEDTYKMCIYESRNIKSFIDFEYYEGVSDYDFIYEIISGKEYISITSNYDNDVIINANSVGDAKIRITNPIDTTQFCEINIEVYKYELTVKSTDGDTIIETEDNSTNIIVKGIESTKWYVECTFSIQSVASIEWYPKIGIFTSTEDNTAPENNKIIFFLDAEIGWNENSNWTNYGVCEVENLEYAWNPGVSNATARHKDNCYTGTSVTYGQEFTLGMLRDGMDFHFYVGGEYRFSMTTLDSLFKNGDEIVPSMVGFFDFNSSVIYSNYSATANEEKVNEKINAISSPKYIGSEGFYWAAD